VTCSLPAITDAMLGAKGEVATTGDTRDGWESPIRFLA
jgi:hypothetical protein